MNELKQELINYLLSDKFLKDDKINDENFDIKFKNIISTVNLNAPVKIISKNKEQSEIILIFNEIINELKKIDLKHKIESLENKVSHDLDESSYSELLSLRNQLKSG